MDSKQLVLFQHTPALQFLGVTIRLGQEISVGVIGKDELMGLVMGSFGDNDGRAIFYHG